MDKYVKLTDLNTDWTIQNKGLASDNILKIYIYIIYIIYSMIVFSF